MQFFVDISDFKQFKEIACNDMRSIFWLQVFLQAPEYDSFDRKLQGYLNEEFVEDEPSTVLMMFLMNVMSTMSFMDELPIQKVFDTLFYRTMKKYPNNTHEEFVEAVVTATTTINERFYEESFSNVSYLKALQLIESVRRRSRCEWHIWFRFLVLSLKSDILCLKKTTKFDIKL